LLGDKSTGGFSGVGTISGELLTLTMGPAANAGNSDTNMAMAAMF
jgi:hypothetical protein